MNLAEQQIMINAKLSNQMITRNQNTRKVAIVVCTTTRRRTTRNVESTSKECDSVERTTGIHVQPSSLQSKNLPESIYSSIKESARIYIKE
jgi:hypothetical protein